MTTQPLFLFFVNLIKHILNLRRPAIRVRPTKLIGSAYPDHDYKKGIWAMRNFKQKNEVKVFMKSLRLLTLITALSLLSFTKGQANEHFVQEPQMTESSFEKIYVSPDRILLFPEGIFYLNEVGELASARLVASDSSGLYVVEDFYFCGHCGRANRDGICQNPDCPLYKK